MTNLWHNPQHLPGLRNWLDAHSRWVGGLVGVMALVVFGSNLSAEPHFVDESAYISQSFYADLLIGGRHDDPTWLEYPGYDLPPLPKYLIGLALRLEGFPRPGPAAARAWYANTSRQFVSPEALVAARRPSVLFGAIGCVAIFALGTMSFDARVGLLAALALMANPLYRMHARRAMSDVPSEAMILATAAIGLWAWKRLLGGRSIWWPTLVLAVGGGTCAGLAVLSKLNGALGGFVLAGWAALGLALGSFSLRGRWAFVGDCFAAGILAFALFVALNPFLTARPPGPIPANLEPIANLTFLERVQKVKDHRAGVSKDARLIFPADALNGPIDQIKAVAIQGFGRFGLFGPRGWTDSTRRFDWSQDRGACVWLPLVGVGFVLAIRFGRDQLRAGSPPTAWAVALQALIALGVVGSFIPLAWDRYYLSIQPGSALLAAMGLVLGFDWVRRSVRTEKAA
ncbi:ArnT family glycosyltransferase [Tundrisphaera sp. TA3]|uniref:ArnT family glycosyltransferase n=1 Tax=Tundrisphaera sp. TA3 TaxID=3435775 RepID=UPI003EBB306C